MVEEVDVEGPVAGFMSAAWPACCGLSPIRSSAKELMF